MTRMSDVYRGWCRECAAMKEIEDGADRECPDCGCALKAQSEITPADRAAERYMNWLRSVMRDGKWGVSPGGAAGELKCARATIDDLVRVGVLERVEYEDKRFPMHKTVMISWRSIEQAKKNFEQTGRWTGKPGQKHEYK